MQIVIKKIFKKDWVTREAGEQLRKMIGDCIKKGGKVELDFTGMTIASTSFFDEGIAKLGMEGCSPEEINRLIVWKGLHPRDQELVRMLCQKRDFEIKIFSQ